MTGLDAVRAMFGKVDAMNPENKMIKYEHKEFYDNYGTGNYTEDKSKNFSFEVTQEKAKKYAEMWLEMGAKHYETSEAHFYEIQTDARHLTQYILYK